MMGGSNQPPLARTPGLNTLPWIGLRTYVGLNNYCLLTLFGMGDFMYVKGMGGKFTPLPKIPKKDPKGLKLCTLVEQHVNDSETSK